MQPTKLFISHASEDKASFVRPLVDALEVAGFQVWLDEVSLKVGDSIWKGISDGLRDCDFGVIVLSPSFMAESKTWPGNELDGMFAIESALRKYILPIWLDVDFEMVKSYAPLLAGRKAALSKSGIPNIVRDLQIAVDTTTVTKAFTAPENPATRLKNLAEEIQGATRAKKMMETPEGMQRVRDNLKELLSSVRTAVEEVQSSAEYFRLVLATPEAESIQFTGIGNLRFGISFTNTFTNTMQGASLRIHIFRITHAFDPSKFHSFTLENYIPVFHPNGSPLWESEQSKFRFTNEQLQTRFMDAVVEAITSVTKRND